MSILLRKQNTSTHRRWWLWWRGLHLGCWRSHEAWHWGCRSCHWKWRTCWNWIHLQWAVRSTAQPFVLWNTVEDNFKFKYIKTITLNGTRSRRLVYQHITARTALSQCMQLEHYVLIKFTLSFRFIMNTNNLQVCCILITGTA